MKRASRVQKEIYREAGDELQLGGSGVWQGMMGRAWAPDMWRCTLPTFPITVVGTLCEGGLQQRTSKSCRRHQRFLALPAFLLVTSIVQDKFFLPRKRLMSRGPKGHLHRAPRPGEMPPPAHPRHQLHT